MVREVKCKASDPRDLIIFNETHRDVKQQMEQVPDNREDMKSRRSRKIESHSNLQECEGQCLMTSFEKTFKTAKYKMSES